MPFKDFGLETLTSSDVNTYLMNQVIIRCTSGTRPGSPTEGWHIYETDTKKFLVYRSGSWVREGEFELCAIKPADEVYSSTSSHADSSLFIPMSTNRTYWLDGFLMISGTVNGHNCVATFTVPSGTSLVYASNHPVLDDPGIISTGGNRVNKRFFDQTSTINIRTTAGNGHGTTNAIYCTRLRGIVKTGSTQGNFQFNWRAASGTITVHELSSLRLQAIVG